VEFLVRDGMVIVRKAGGDGRRGKRLIRTMRGKAETRLSTDEIMALTRDDDT
jgi:hypothetical protein